MSFGVIYKVSNKINGRIYIGQTVQKFARRKQNHLYDAKHNRFNSIFHKAIRKYGKDNFIWEIIEYCDSKEELDEMEFHYIVSYGSYSNGYNSTLGGEGAPGAIRSDSVKLKISNSMKGSNAYWYGKHHSEATKNKISRKLSGKNSPNFGKRCSEDTKKKISKSLIGHSVSLETRKKLSEIHKGKRCGADSKCSKKYVVTDPNGLTFVVDGLIDFCRRYKDDRLNYKNLSQCATGRRKHHKKYKCRYYDSETDYNIPIYKGVL